MGGGPTTPCSGSPLARSGACRDVEDARWAVELPSPVLGRCSRDRGSPGHGRCETGGGATTARSGSPLARSGARRDVEDARRAVELPPPMMGSCSGDRGLAVKWKMQDEWWNYHRQFWVAARKIGGWPWWGERKMGGGAATACAGSLLAKSG